jgi:hypothetical protein
MKTGNLFSKLTRISPAMVVMATATVVVLAVVAGGYVSRGGFWTPRVDPHVYVEGAGQQDGRYGRANYQQYRMVFTGEVYSTSERLRAASALAYVTWLRAASEAVAQRPLRSVEELLACVERAGLMPPGLSIAENKTTVVSDGATLYVRFRPAPLAVEVVSIPTDSRQGPALMVRVPEDDSSETGAASRYFVATQLDAVSIPAPFAPASEVIGAGWTVETYKYKPTASDQTR